MSKYSKILTKEFLAREYIVNKKTSYQIANEMGCSFETILRYLRKYNIPRRNNSETHSKYSNILTKEFLIKEYIINGKTIYQIAKEANCHPVTIWDYLIKNNIKNKNKIRNISEANKVLNRNKGKTNPNYKGGGSLKQHYCKECGNEISLSNWYMAKETARCEYCYRKFNKGKHHPNYIEGLIRKYPLKFNNIIKESIRIRDHRQCQICGKSEKNYYRKLDIHHIDYNKNNLDPENLISLCDSCHTKTNYNRDIYIEFFKILKETING